LLRLLRDSITDLYDRRKHWVIPPGRLS